MLSSVSIKNNQFYCEDCRSCFESQQIYEEHKRDILDKLQFLVCRECNRKFSSDCLLNTHALENGHSTLSNGHSVKKSSPFNGQSNILNDHSALNNADPKFFNDKTSSLKTQSLMVNNDNISSNLLNGQSTSMDDHSRDLNALNKFPSKIKDKSTIFSSLNDGVVISNDGTTTSTEIDAITISTENSTTAVTAKANVAENTNKNLNEISIENAFENPDEIKVENTNENTVENINDNLREKTLEKSEFSSRNSVQSKSGKPLFVCNVCGRVFQHRSSYRAHEPTHTGVKPFQCNICQKRFALQWNLVSHLHTHTGVRRYKCHKCHSMFARSTTLREHMQVHLPLHQRPVCRCEICGKIFRSKKSLSGHKVVHSKVRPFSCDICHRGFVSRRNLRNHQKVHLEGKLFRCDACAVWFRTSINLTIHRAEKHLSPEYTNFPHVISQLAQKIETACAKKEQCVCYPCEQCSTEFADKQLWVNHMQKHFVDQYKCICYMCGRENETLPQLRRHLETHTEGIPPPPSVSPPKLALSNYDMKYFISFFSNSGIDILKPTEKNFETPPPPPPHTFCGNGCI